MKRQPILGGLAVLALLFASLTASAQTITSKAAGGSWEDPATWIGGIVPTATHDVIIDGTVSVTSSASKCSNLTINAGKTLQNGGGLGWVTLHVLNHFTNNGTVQDNPQANSFWLEIGGDLANNGIMRQTSLYLTTTKDQHISQAAGSRFESLVYLCSANGYTDTTGRAIAASDLTFTRMFELKWLAFDADGHGIHLKGGSIGYGLVKNADRLQMSEQASIGSVSFQSDELELRGVFQAHDAGVTLDAAVTNEDTMQNAGGLGWLTLHVKGNFTNNGLIRNHPTANAFHLEIEGDATNNGVWKCENTYFPTHRPQRISMTPGKPFDSKIFLSTGNGYSDTMGLLIAATDLEFGQTVDLKWLTFDADHKKLSMAGGAIMYGTVLNVRELSMRYGTSIGDVTFVGDTITLTNSFSVHNANVRMSGHVVNRDTLQNSGGLGWLTLHISNSFTNLGTVRNNPAGNSLHVEVGGDIRNRGIWTCRETHLHGSGRRVVELQGTQTMVYNTGKKVIFTGNSVVPQFNTTSAGLTIVASEASLTVEDGNTNFGWSGLTNLGRFVSPKKTTADRGYYFFGGWLEVESGRVPDSIVVESFGSQTPETYGNAVSSWWRIRTVPNDERRLTRLELRYGNEHLNGNGEPSLKVFRSTDHGNSWMVINDPQIYRDTFANKIVLYDAQIPGDYVLASSDEYLPAQPTLIVSLAGSGEVRVGAPNPYVVNLYNKSDKPSGPVFLRLEANEAIHFLRIEDESEGYLRSIPASDLVYDGEDQSVILLIGSLAPREERDFMVYVTSLRPSSIIKKRDPQVFWFIAAAAVYVTGAVITDYITDRMVEGCFDAWMPPGSTNADKQEAKKEIKQAIKDGAQGAAVTTGKQLAEDGTKKILGNSILGKLIWPAKLGYNILACIENTIKGAQCYLGLKPIKDILTNSRCAGAQKQVVAVTSKDPNEKSGPSGIGSQHFMATASRMPYIIHFENAPEAQAAAYRIVIRDTLSESFDENSVEFGQMSHEGFTASRDGKVLIWEITGIDLPPNKVPPEGEGWVTFSVLPKGGLPTGTTLTNRASITFDLNDPIQTGLTINVLDLEAPTTTMLQPASDGDSIATIRWRAEDGSNGSGYRAATIFMAEADGQYQIIGEQNSDSVRVVLKRETTYHFYALSSDHVGNHETSRPTPVSVRITSDVARRWSAGLTWEIFPNPVQNMVSIKLSVGDPAHMSVSVIDELGRSVVESQELGLLHGTHTVSLDLAKLAIGSYHMRLVHDGVVETRSFTVVR